jgi:4-carboxymuconolactone decarboxylase
MVERELPSDVFEESGSRLPLPDRDGLSDAAKAIYDRHLDPKGGSLVGLKGPGGLKLHSPQLAERSQPLSRHLRFESGYSNGIRELAILVTAREMDSRFEWAAHEPEALRQGLSQEIIDIVKYRKDVTGIPETEAVVIRFGRQLLQAHRVEHELFARALELFGRKTLVELVALMGNYSATALLLAAFDVQLLPGDPIVLPVP